MDLLPTGSDSKIFEVKTNEVHVIMKGKKSQSPFINHSGSNDSTIVFFGNNIRKIRLKNYNNNLTFDNNSKYSIGIYTAPLFYEQNDYEIIIKGIEDVKVDFWHENFLVRNKVEPISDSDNILTGMINFDNNIGYSDLIIKVNGKINLIIRIEVFPSKISYKDDYKNIIKDINDEINSVLFDFLKKTYKTFKLGDKTNYTPAVFFAIIRGIFEDFLKATDTIIKTPHHILTVEHEILPAHKVKRVDSKTIKWVERHPESVIVSPVGMCASKAMALKKRVNYNTVENRFTKFILLSIIKRIKDFRHRYILGNNADSSVLDETNKMINEIRKRVYRSFLNNVDGYKPTQSMSLVFGMAPGYRNLYKYYLMLLKGLAVNGDIFKLSTKDIALLYEYWCFIKLGSLLKKSCKLVSPDVIKVDNSGITVSLVKGKKSEVRYINPNTGESIILTYNPGELNTQTVSQRPDNVLTLEKTGSDIPYKYIFDAKYRIDPAFPGTGYPDSKPGPRVEDINAMHRYRDSIVFENNTPSRYTFEKSMFGAYVLFPYANEREYTDHKFYRSIETVNIGGLPFLPGATSLVEELLSELITESKESAFERATLPRGIERMLAKVDWKVKDMLVGALRSKKQLEISLSNKFYHVPAKYVSEDDLPVRYVALYQSDNIFKKESGIRYYGTVVKTYVCKRKDIPIPMTRDNSDELYYRFDIKSWEQLPVAIKVREEGVIRPKFANMFLFQNCRDSYELFNIHSEEQYRLLQELKRISRDTAVNNDEHKSGFRLNDEISIYLLGGDIIVCTSTGKIINKTPVSEFIRKPRHTFNMIKNTLYHSGM